MKRVSVVIALAVLACSAPSESHSREPVTPAPSSAPVDALGLAGDPDVPSLDAPVVTDAPAPNRPTTPRTVYPVLRLDPLENGTRVTIGIGKRQGVNSSWKARLIDKDGADIKGGELAISAIGDFQTTATTKLVRERIPAGVQAHADSH